jgi:hypothetical protein
MCGDLDVNYVKIIKAIPLQTLTGPCGSSRLRLVEVLDN